MDAAIQRDRIGGAVIDWSSILTADGPIAGGIGLTLGAIAYRIRTAYVERRTRRAFVGADKAEPEQPFASVAHDLMIDALRPTGAVSAVLVRWDAAPSGGRVTAIAEWPGLDERTIPAMRGRDVDAKWSADVIEPLRSHEAVFLERDRLTSEALSDIYSLRDVSCAYLRAVACDAETMTYIEARYRVPPDLSASIREPMSVLAARIAEILDEHPA